MSWKRQITKESFSRASISRMTVYTGVESSMSELKLRWENPPTKTKRSTVTVNLESPVNASGFPRAGFLS